MRAIEGGMLLCGPHLLEHRRNNHAIRVVDGSICRVCGGAGEQHTVGLIDPEKPAGRWVRCPHCQGTGYDPDIRPRAPRRAPVAPAGRRPPAAGPQPDAVRAEKAAAEAEAARTETTRERLAAEAAEAMEFVQRAAEELQRKASQQRAAEAAEAQGKFQHIAEQLQRKASQQRAEEMARAQQAGRVASFPRRKRRNSAAAFLLQAVALALTGAALGALFSIVIVPVLPDAAAEQVIALQDRVRELLQ